MTNSAKLLLLATAYCVAAPTLHAADLVDAYELARDSDPQLALAKSQQLVTEANEPIARSVLLPQISGRAQLQRNESDSEQITSRPNPDGTVSFGPSTGDSSTTNRDLSLNLNQSIYDHSQWSRLRATRDRSLAAGADYETALDALAVRTAEAYFEALSAIDALVFSRNERHAVGRQLDQSQQRFDVGLIAITDVYEARSRFDAARAAAITSQNRLDDALETLAELTGIYLTDLEGLGENFQPEMPQPIAIDAWVQQAIAENPQLASRQFAVAAARDDIDAERAGHLPTLSGFASYNDNTTRGNISSNDFRFPADSSRDGATIGIVLDVPIFSGFGVSSRVQQAVYRREAATDQLEQQRRAVVRSTKVAYRALTAGLSEIDARRQAVFSAEKAVEASEAGLEVGTRTIVDVLLAQQVLYQALRDYSNARHQFLVNTLRLKQSAGVVDYADVVAINRHLDSDADAKLEGTELDEDVLPLPSMPEMNPPPN